MRFLFVDRIIHMEPRVDIRGLKHVTTDDFYLIADARTGEVHFPCALIGETIGQLAAWNVMYAMDFQARPVAGIAQQAKMHRFVLPGETLMLQANIESLDEKAVQYNGRAMVNDEVVFELEGSIGPLLPMDDFADPALAQAQFDEIYHPGQIRDSIASLRKSDVPEDIWANRHFTWDEVVEHQAAQEMSVVKRITRSAPYFPDHFPKKPVLPLTVLLETIAQLATEFANDFPAPFGWEVRSLSRVKMVEFVKPGDTLLIKLIPKQALDNSLILKVLISLPERRVCHLECNLSPKEIQT